MKAFVSILKLSTILLILFVNEAFGAEKFCDRGQLHSIDIWYAQAMDQTGGVTAKMRQVQGEAYKKWDYELNLTYQKLLSNLSESDKKILRESQREWLKFREAETKFWWSKAMYGDRGTLALIEISEMGRQQLKDRVCELERYLATVSQKYHTPEVRN